jgi:hypothetical protein
MAFTVVPLHNISLPAGTQIPFGNGFVFQDVPEWLKKDQGILNNLSFHDRESALGAKHALVAEYPSAAIGEPDPQWKGKEPKPIQETQFQSVILANLALWFRQPSPVCFTVGFHALTWDVPGEPEKVPIIQQTEVNTPLYCHPDDAHNPVTINHVLKAASLHQVLMAIPRKNPVWEALRATWAALTMYSADRRYPFFWMALESLFGSDDTNEIGYKLAQRIAFFVADNPQDARDIFRKVKTCYKMRSTIIHGRWKDDPKIDAVMADTETIIRTVFRLLLDNPALLKTFLSSQRNDFLEDWVFSRYTDPPPFPTI